jgi:hypothetical protein
LAGVTGPLSAQKPDTSKKVMKSAAGTVAPADSDAIDDDAIDALRKMGEYLRTLNVFSVHAIVNTEDVRQDGLKVQTTSVADVLAQRPGKLRVEIANDKQPRTWYYDGKTFTLWAPRPKFYAIADAPPTINELAKKLDEKFGIDVPFVDLFRWGTPESDEKEITVAMDVGPNAINGTTCEHYVFRQPGLDWQIWIQQGDYPLPLKIVLTTTTDEARPQHETVYTWNLAPSFNDKAFAFTPPSDAKKITFLEVQEARTMAKKQGEK